MRSLAFALFAATVLAACQGFQPVPEGFTGPVAVITDSGERVSGSKAALFVVQQVDGNAIDDSFGASAGASRNQGFALNMVVVNRKVPVRPMKLRLHGGYATGAPIQGIFDQLTGSDLSVDGVVDFTPVAGGSYIVMGTLAKDGSSIWIQDQATGQPVTPKITGK